MACATPVCEKVGEETLETIAAAIGESDERLAAESADVLYHLLVLNYQTVYLYLFQIRQLSF